MANALSDYYHKIKHFSITEKLQIIKYTIGSILSNKIPKGLKHCYHLVQNLESKGIQVSASDSSILFKHPICQNTLHFALKRSSSDTLVFEQIIEFEEYKLVIEIINSFNITIDNIIDAGANIGLASLYFRQYFPNAEIILLEPEKSTYNRMIKNLELNQYSKVHPLNFGLWKEETTLQIDRNFRDREDWSVRLTPHIAGKNIIKTKTISGLISEFNLDTIDFLKIDIEGAEKELFLEDPNISVWLSKVKVIALEIHDETSTRSDIETLLLSNGFELPHSKELTIGINKKFI